MPLANADSFAFHEPGGIKWETASPASPATACTAGGGCITSTVVINDGNRVLLDSGWVYETLYPSADDFMVGDLEWQSMMNEIMGTILGDVAFGTRLADAGEQVESITREDAGGDLSLDAQLQRIADQFTQEQRQILDQLRQAEELMVCR